MIQPLIPTEPLRFIPLAGEHLEFEIELDSGLEVVQLRRRPGLLLTGGRAGAPASAGRCARGLWAGLLDRLHWPHLRRVVNLAPPRTGQRRHRRGRRAVKGRRTPIGRNRPAARARRRPNQGLWGRAAQTARSPTRARRRLRRRLVTDGWPCGRSGPLRGGRRRGGHRLRFDGWLQQSVRCRDHVRSI